MTRRVFTFFTIFTGVVLAGSAYAQSVVIQGRVVSAETGDPLAHARVIIYNDAAPLPPLFTDGQGQFASSPRPPGRYRLTAKKSGFALTAVSPINLNSTEPLVVRLPRAAAITGRVVDRFGEPAAGVQVMLFSSRPQPAPGVLPANQPAPSPQVAPLAQIAQIMNGSLKRVVTDDLGEYRFGGLTEGTYYVAIFTMRQDATLGMNLQTPTYFPGVESAADAAGVAVRPGEERSVDFAGFGSQQNAFTAASELVINTPVVFTGPANSPNVLRPVKGAAKLRGRITRTDGLPIARATVSTRVTSIFQGQVQQTFTLTVSAQTDEDGLYEIADLPAGKYRVNAAKLGFTSAALENLDLAEGQTKTKIDLTLPRYSAVTGRVLDEFGDPVESVPVSLSRITFEAGRRRLVGVRGVPPTSTDDTGRYRLYGLEPGQFIVNASPGQVVPNQLMSDLAGYAATYFPGTSNAREAQLVPVPRAQDVTGLDFTLVPTQTASVAGIKLGADGEPMGGSLSLMESARSGAIITPAVGARIKDDGTFEFPSVAPGEYVIQADRGRVNTGNEGDFVSQYVTVNGRNVGDLMLRATPGSTISGHVVLDGDGPAPSYRQLTVVPDRADLDRTPNNGSIAKAEVRADLSFEVTGIHGPRRIGTDRIVSGWGLKSVIANGVDVTDRPIDFGTASQSLSDVQVILTNRLTEIMFTGVDSRGNPTRDYALLVFPGDRERWYAGSRYFKRAAPGADGYTLIRGLPAGEYLVVALSNAAVLKDSFDAWQDPDVLETLIQRATRAMLTESGKLSISGRVVTP